MKRCRYCNTLQPEEAFPVCSVVRERVYRRRRCAHCFRQSVGQRQAQLRRWLDDYKKTLRCLHCGFADHRALAFHHDSSADKEFNVADMVRHGHSREHILAEIAKCSVLCSNCHAIAHADERSSALDRPPPPVAPLPEREPSATAMRKLCRYCHIEQDESCFEVCKVIGARVYRRHKCRACKQQTQSLRRQKLRAWVEDFKKTLRCEECGFGDFRALEFHHPDGQEKDAAVGSMVKDNRSIAAVRREIARCVVLCANCHRIAHYQAPPAPTAAACPVSV